MKRHDIKVKITYSSPALYGPARHHLTDRTYFLDTFAPFVKNAADINWRGVSSVCYDADLQVVFQVSGYTYRRGAFCDLPDIRQYAPASGEPWPYHTEEELYTTINTVPTWADEIMQSIATEG